MLEPVEALRQAELAGDYTTRLALTEEFKTYPFGAVWDYYCATQGVPVRESWITEVQTYERAVQNKRMG
jgi:L-rhamnose isomerase